MSKTGVLVFIVVASGLGWALAFLVGNLWVLVNLCFYPEVGVQAPLGEAPIEVVLNVFAILTVVYVLALVLRREAIN